MNIAVNTPTRTIHYDDVEEPSIDPRNNLLIYRSMADSDGDPLSVHLATFAHWDYYQILNATAELS